MKIHFIGIGGIGISALARYYLAQGHKVSGSDLIYSEITDDLKKEKVNLFIGKNKAKNVPKNVDMVVYSPAVPKDNPELKKAQKLKIVNCKLKIKSYPQALGELTKKYFTIAISGTHGKSTTTTMIGLLLAKAGFDPTIIVGTKVKEFSNSNCRVGKSKYLVIEADEHFASFLNYWPKMIVLTNIETEHLDYFKNLKNILKTYKKFIEHLSERGVLIVNEDDKNIQKIISNFPPPFFKRKGFNKYSISNFQISKLNDIKKLKRILKIPGEHNVANALAALTVARTLKIPDKISFKALSEYKGCWRRFEIKEYKIQDTRYKILVVSDYAHHPTEIKVTLKAAREKYPKKKIWCVYQPHQYQRTHYLFNDFVKVFKEAPADKIIVTDIYDVAGRENKKIKKKVDSEKLVKAIKKPNVIYLPKEKIVNFLKKNISGGGILIIMGAGDIYDIAKQLSLV